MTTKLVSFYVPEDQELLAAIGVVALRHEHLNHALRMTIKTLCGLTPAEALAATAYEGSGQLRDRIKKIARRRLSEGAPLLRLQAIIAECMKLTERRNELIHGFWAQELDGEANIRDAYGTALPLPTAQELRELGGEIERITKQLNFERLEGFLKRALSEQKQC